MIGGHKELKMYLMSLKEILDVIIENEDQLKIYVKYNPDLITFKLIKMEIFFFLDILDTPSLLAFDKHSTNKTSEYKILRDSICCGHCFKDAIESLFEIEGIEKVESNSNEKNRCEDVVININYNFNRISNGNMKQIEKDLNI